MKPRHRELPLLYPVTTEIDAAHNEYRSAIGGFFDDQVNELLGIPDREAVLYITTLGRPARRQ